MLTAKVSYSDLLNDSCYYRLHWKRLNKQRMARMLKFHPCGPLLRWPMVHFRYLSHCTFMILIWHFEFTFGLECKSWCHSSSWSASGSSIWSQSSSLNDTENDFNTKWNGPKLKLLGFELFFTFFSRIISEFPTLFWFQEEVVLKRCWLARYWGLAAKYGKLCAQIILSYVLKIILCFNVALMFC